MEHTQGKWIARHENDKHWIEDVDHIPIANIFDSGEEGKANAEFIVRACNNHYDLLAMLKLAAKYVSKMVADDVKTAVPPIVALNRIEAAIARAEGKEV